MLVRIILAIPHLIVLWALGIAAQVVVIICWFAALFMGRLPASLGEFLVGYLRWASRFYGYLFLLTDKYPPFELGDAEYPVRVLVRPGRLNRLAVFFRLILAIPAYILAALVLYGMETLVMFVTWLIVLIAGHMPRSLHEAIAAGTRYHIRFYGYLFLLTGTYPWGLFGDQPDQPGNFPPPGYGQPAPGAEPALRGSAPAVPAGVRPARAGPAGVRPARAGPAGGQRPARAGPAGVRAARPSPARVRPAWAAAGCVWRARGGAWPGPGSRVTRGRATQRRAATHRQPRLATRRPVEPVRWLGGDQPWRLVLSSTAKGLLALFLALGVVLFAGYLVADHRGHQLQQHREPGRGGLLGRDLVFAS